MRTDYCGLLNLNYLDRKVKLCGWVNSIRVLKNIIFIDLRDYTGIIQIFIDNSNINLWNLASSLTEESCVQIYGKIKARIVNKNIDKYFVSDVEVAAFKLNIFNYSNILPLDIKVNHNSEKIRLKYRYLDLRRLDMFNIFKFRSNVVFFIHQFLQKNNFLEVETPFLTKSYPEGAKDYLVSRLKKKNFYALPQSPQIFKQILMISGFDRYYQITKCFRDEDSRSDRQPEFTQIDIELSFSDFNEVSLLIEKLLFKLWFNFKKIKFNIPFKKIKYWDSILNYGTDKPDLRNPLKFFNMSIFSKYIWCKSNNFKVIGLLVDKNIVYFDFDFIIKNIINKYSLYDCICIKILNFIKGQFVYEVFSFFNFQDNLLIQNICFKFKLKIGDLFFIFIGETLLLNKNLVFIRKGLCKKFELFKKNNFYPVWITDFPMFYYDDNHHLKSYHHPFTMPLVSNLSDFKSDNDDYRKLLSSSYDLVINGYEIGSGSTRIHDVEIQKKIFDLLGISKIVQEKKYGFFLNSLKFGTPPHIGLALGLDRMIMLLMNIKNIRDVIAFPKTTSGVCLLTGAPDDI